MNWLYLDFPHLYMEYHHKSLASGAAFALVQEGRSPWIWDCNSAAAKAGVETGMRLNTAFCLAPELCTETYQKNRATSALQAQATHAAQFSAHISLDPPQGLYMEVATMRRLMGTPRQQAEQMKLRYEKSGHTCHYALAPNPRAARLLARCKAGNPVVSSSTLQAELRPLPVSCLEPEAALAGRLRKSGIRTLGDLMRLPAGDIAYRMDETLALELRHLSGESEWTPPQFTSGEEFIESVDLEEDFDSILPMRFVLTQTFSKLCQFLQRRCLLTARVRLTLLSRDAEPQPHELSLAVADHRLESWTYRMNTFIESLQLNAPIYGFRLEANEFTPVANDSLELFTTRAEDAESRSRLLNRVVSRLGVDAVQFIRLGDDQRPEYQTCHGSGDDTLKVQSEGSKPGSSVTNSSLPPGISAGDRPCWLLPEPLPVNVNCYQFLRGPARLEHGWWDARKASRDYYLAETSSHALHWIFKDEKGQWMWHGIFA